MENAQEFKVRLMRSTGLSESAIDAAWPEWWSESADASPSARTELRFSLARNLGLDPRSLLADLAPTFVWDDRAKFKGFTGDARGELPAISAFGAAIVRQLLPGVPQFFEFVGTPASDLRRRILGQAPFVGLRQLLALCWSLGIPVVHLRVHPLAAKRMCAMTAGQGERHGILLARDAVYPSPVCFHLAHELGHIALGHVRDGSSVIDMADPSEREGELDPEEQQADRYALELLTGSPEPQIAVQGEGRSATELASQVLRLGIERGIEPGTLALCYGFATKNWATAFKALDQVYAQKHDVWREVNRIAIQMLQWQHMPDTSECFLRAVLGAPA